jgi:hypothetical protein
VRGLPVGQRPAGLLIEVKVFREVLEISVHCRRLPSLGLGFELLQGQPRLCFQEPSEPGTGASLECGEIPLVKTEAQKIRLGEMELSEDVPIS